MDGKQIGQKLIKLRGNRSQGEVAKALELTQSAISQYENGDRIPSDEIKIRIARYFGQSVESIFFES